MLFNLAKTQKKAAMAKQLLFLSPKRCKSVHFVIDIMLILVRWLDFRASQNLNKLFNVYIDGKPIQVSPRRA